MIAGPREQANKAVFEIFRLPGLMVFATDDKNFLWTAYGGVFDHTNIVKWIGGIPVESVLDTAGRNWNSDHVSSIRALLGVHRDAVIERSIRGNDGGLR